MILFSKRPDCWPPFLKHYFSSFLRQLAKAHKGGVTAIAIDDVDARAVISSGRDGRVILTDTRAGNGDVRVLDISAASSAMSVDWPRQRVAIGVGPIWG